MHIAIEEDVVIEVAQNMVKEKELEHIFFAARGVRIDCRGRNQKSKNRVLGIRMLLHQVWCTLDIELAGLTGQNRSNTEHFIKSL